MWGECVCVCVRVLTIPEKEQVVRIVSTWNACVSQYLLYTMCKGDTTNPLFSEKIILKLCSKDWE